MSRCKLLVCKGLVTWKGLLITVSVGAGVIAISASLAASQPKSPLAGDLNCDGVVDFQDIVGFVQAAKDSAKWCQEFGHDTDYLLRIADFSGDGQIGIPDIPGFVDVLIAAVGLPDRDRGAAEQLVRGRTTAGYVDLDVDSDNNNGLGSPDRSPEEDAIEDDLYAVGKEITIGGANAVRAVLEFNTTAGSPTGRSWRITFPNNITAVRPSFFHRFYSAALYLTSGQTYTYPNYGTYVLGDMNGDGAFNNQDIDAFVMALLNPAAYRNTYHLDPNIVGDFNRDWVLNNQDIDGFQAALFAGSTEIIPIRIQVTGTAASEFLGQTRITAQADTDADGNLDGDDATDAVRVTVWDGSTMPPSAETGAPRGWGAGLAVSPFSTVNLRNGNLLTAVPLVSWDPVGPPVSFTLYHNSFVAAAGGPDHSAWGFDLGDGWSVSYGGHIDGSSTDDIVAVVEADGRRNLFTWDGVSDPDRHYLPPAGDHDLLDWNDTNDQWTLTSANQWTAIFDDDGYLAEIHDSAGNVSTIARDAQNNNRIAYIASAADDPNYENNRLVFGYDGNGRLSTITDPISREWDFYYDGSGRLWKIEYPHSDVPDSWVEINYAPSVDARIQHIRSRERSVLTNPSTYAWTWTYTYGGAAGQLTQVQDADHVVDQTTVRYTQSFDYASAPTQAGLWETTYTDRRDYDWVVRFDGLGNAVEVTDPLTHTRSWACDADHNPISFTDELSHTWTATYGFVGNVETVTSPIQSQTWTLSWDHPTGTPSNFYRPTQVADPLSHWVQYDYDDSNDPTLVTTVREMADGQGNSAAETTLEYYGSADANARGQLKLVTDANGVKHEFVYNAFGYMQDLTDGWIVEQRLYDPSIWPCEAHVISDPVGRATGASDGSGASAGNSYDDNGSPTESTCYVPISTSLTRLGPAPGPAPMLLTQCLLGPQQGIPQYDVAGRPMNLERCINTTPGFDSRSYHIAYDDLGRPTQHSTVTGSSSWQVERTFDQLEYDEEGRLTYQRGPDGEIATYTVGNDPGYDELGRPQTVTRSAMSATYVYDAASRLTEVHYANDTKIVRDYDAANRLNWIKHYDASESLLLEIDYSWNLDNTVASRTETKYDSMGPTEVAVVTFTHDNRARLIAETRVVDQTTTVYNLAYTYDQLGNRLTRHDAVAGMLTAYTYDVQFNYENFPDPDHKTKNNRLLWYTESFGDEQSGWTLARTVKYLYYNTGHVANITIKDEYLGTGETPAAYNFYYDLALHYASNGHLWRVIWDQWKVDPESGDFTDYSMTAAREFYYDNGRARYMTRDVDPNSSYPPISPWYWTDYQGVQPYADFTHSGGQNETPAEATRFLPGYGVHAQQTLDNETNPTRYLHGDLVRSTMLTTDESGTAASSVAYTAFGEPITAGGVGVPPANFDTRYQYGGGWGYESDFLTLTGANGDLPPITLLHVGERWYQPNIGRFIQRDPMDIAGGLNSYTYASLNPIDGVDPDGLMSVWQPPIGHGWDNWDDLFRAVKEARRVMIYNYTRWRATGMIKFLERAQNAARRLANLRKLLPPGSVICLLLLPVAGGYAGAAAAHAAGPALDRASGGYGPWLHGSGEGDLFRGDDGTFENWT